MKTKIILASILSALSFITSIGSNSIMACILGSTLIFLAMIGAIELGLFYSSEKK